MLVVIDIDGTIADAGRRFKEAGPEPSRHNWKAYTAWVESVQNEQSLLEDAPVPCMLNMVSSLAKEHHLIYLTSREEQWRSVTRKWLKAHKFPERPLLMRPNGSRIETAELKEERIQHCQGDEQVLVIDDDEHGTLEAVCKKHGWVFLKARSGGQK